MFLGKCICNDVFRSYFIQTCVNSLSQVLPQLKFWILIILLLGLTQISLQVVTSKINLKVLLMPQGKCSVSSASMLCVNS